MIAFLRTLFLLCGWGRRRSRLGIHDLATVRMRAWPADIDVLGHVNNGIYLTLMDLGRMDLLLRTGLWPRMRALGVYPVVRSSTVSYRKSIQLWQRFTLESKVVGWDDRTVYLEQRFVVRGEVWARGIIRGSFLRKGEGPLSTARLRELVGIDVEPFPPSPELAGWAAEAALPSTRAAAPSVWE